MTQSGHGKCNERCLISRGQGLRFGSIRIVYGNARHWIDWRLPGAAFENPRGISKSRLPTRMDSSAGEIDVAQMIFVIEAWRLKPYDVHEGAAAIAGHLLDLRCFALRFRHQANEFAYDVAKMMERAM